MKPAKVCVNKTGSIPLGPKNLGCFPFGPLKKLNCFFECCNKDCFIKGCDGKFFPGINNIFCCPLFFFSCSKIFNASVKLGGGTPLPLFFPPFKFINHFLGA